VLCVAAAALTLSPSHPLTLSPSLTFSPLSPPTLHTLILSYPLSWLPLVAFFLPCICAILNRARSTHDCLLSPFPLPPPLPLSPSPLLPSVRGQIIGNFMSFLIVHTLQPSLASWHAAAAEACPNSGRSLGREKPKPLATFHGWYTPGWPPGRSPGPQSYQPRAQSSKSFAAWHPSDGPCTRCQQPPGFSAGHSL